MSATWDDELASLREQYRRESADRLRRLDECLERLAEDPEDAEARAALRRDFHALAGSGGTYGLPRVSTLGAEGEALALSAPPRPLARAREIVAALQGELLAEGVPAAPAAGPPPPEAPERRDVLLVDDDGSLGAFLARALEQDGFRVRRALTFEGGREAIAARVPDVLLVDAALPDGSGYRLVEELRTKEGGEATVVLVVSVHGTLLDRVDAIHCGADATFAKPIDLDALLRRVHFLLEAERGAPGRVLAMDDDLAQLTFLRSVLTSAGFEFRGVSDPARLESEITAFQPDLVLMDVLLPGVSGPDLVRSLRQDERHATLPVVMVTTEATLGARLEGARAGGDEYLTKPVAPALLLTTVVARIERARFLKTLVERDGLTRLLTHSAIQDRARTAAVRKRRTPERSWALAMVDLDRFKEINDQHGHAAGDGVLRALSVLFRRRLRQSDSLGRYGGEEFALVLEDLTGEEAVRLLDRLRLEFAEIPLGPAHDLRVTFSAGVAVLEPGMEPRGWFEAADRALYEAKRTGRNRVVLAARS